MICVTLWAFTMINYFCGEPFIINTGQAEHNNYNICLFRFSRIYISPLNIEKNRLSQGRHSLSGQKMQFSSFQKC